MSSKIKPADLSAVRLHSVRDRECKVHVKDFAKPARKESFSSFIDCIPEILAGSDIKRVCLNIASAKAKNKPVMWALGAHVIKCGLSPLVIDLIERGFVSSVSLNGGGLIHDTEVALFGETSEDVSERIRDGRFGMVKETGEFINRAAEEGVGRGLGFGESVGKKILQEKPDNMSYCISSACVRNGIPLTVHVAIGTDTIHTHPSFNPSITGQATHLDFRLYSAMVGKLSGGGVYLNMGSAVILPEVFLKAVSLNRNIGVKLEDFTCANFDFARQYRAQENVLKRPGGKDYSITGHHELTIPLLYRMLLEGMI